jgi:hypothetical protein
VKDARARRAVRNCQASILNRAPSKSSIEQEEHSMTTTARLTTIVSIVLSLAAAACGEKAPGPGTKNSVTAYESDGTTVIKFEGCRKLGRTHDYPACGSSLRESVGATMCTRGKGTHKWLYQIGDGARIPQTTLCK